MKNIKSILFLALAFGTLSSCTEEDAYEIPTFKTTLLKEDFQGTSDLATLGWDVVAQQGTKNWGIATFQEDRYTEFTSFGSGQALNIAWLISPEIDMDLVEGEKVYFQSAHNFLTHLDNTLELMVSTDYDGTNFAQASWVKVNAKTVTPDNARNVWVPSGAVDISNFTGKVHIAFKVTGSGTNTNLDGTFRVDNVHVYN